MEEHHENYVNPYDDIESEERLQDEKADITDSRFQKLEALIRMHGRNPDKTPFSSLEARSSALGLHRWIEGSQLARKFNGAIEKSTLRSVYGKDVSRETLSLQRKAAQDIVEASKLLHDRLGAAMLFTDLGLALEHAYSEVKNAANENPDDPRYDQTRDFMKRTNQPSWQLMQDVSTALLRVMDEVANKADENLASTKAPMGQPPKLDRDRSFFQWQKQIASDLNISIDDSIYVASESWGIYFPEEKINADAAIKAIRTQRVKANGK